MDIDEGGNMTGQVQGFADLAYAGLSETGHLPRKQL